jgi:hypothetical protein
MVNGERETIMSFIRCTVNWTELFLLTQRPNVGYDLILDHTQRRNTVDRTSLDKRSASRRDPYLTTHNTHNRQAIIPLAGFKPTISTSERPTYALDRAATGIGNYTQLVIKIGRLGWLGNVFRM